MSVTTPRPQLAALIISVIVTVGWVMSVWLRSQQRIEVSLVVEIPIVGGAVAGLHNRIASRRSGQDQDGDS